jgi:hypothetical protein
MLTRLPQTLTISVIAAALFIAGCSTRKRQIEITKPQPSTNPPASNEPEWRPSDDNTASVITEIPEAELVKYMDPNAKLEFKFSYAGVDKAGDIVFVDGKARIEITQLPVNQKGTMVMQLFENSVMKLEGTKDNVTLRAGANSESLSLKIVPKKPETKPDTPEVKPPTPDVKPPTPDVKPPTPDVKPDPVPETAELVLNLEIQ